MDIKKIKTELEETITQCKKIECDTIDDKNEKAYNINVMIRIISLIERLEDTKTKKFSNLFKK